jgi:hypothetical protein
MMKELFKEIEYVLNKYPKFKIEYVNKSPFITGDLDIFDNDLYIETYSLDIYITKDYPYRFPKVIETSMKIPREPDRHVNSDGTLCFGNLQDEYRVCKSGIKLMFFFDTILRGHLCREFIKEKSGKYPNGERSHGNEGLWESYYEIFKTKDKQSILKEFDFIISNIKKPERNNPCYCNKKVKYKKCHLRLEEQLFDIGKDKAIEIMEKLRNDFFMNNKRLNENQSLFTK